MSEHRTVFFRGLRIIRGYVTTHPLPFTLAVIGAAVYAGATVGSTFVLGHVTDDVVTPAFRESVDRRTIVWGVVALIAVGLIRAGGIDGLPQGLDTRVGQRGESLPVGERQFVALAGAQLAGPGLLILDEATSAVDPESERALAEALQRLSEGRTTLTVAHRLSTAEGADSVLVFDRDEVVERGEHAELIGAGGVYAGLYESWLGNTRSA